MKKHENFFIVKAQNNYELGLFVGEKFGKMAERAINDQKQNKNWLSKLENSRKYLDITQSRFPQYIKELRGYADGAHVNFNDLWTISLEDEILEEVNENCTTIITNRGTLMAHNEDWDEDSENSVCLLVKTVRELTIFEIFYFNTLGGNSISINSSGFVSSVNSMAHSDRKFGIPYTVTARWLSETKDPDEDFRKLSSMPRGLGLNFNIINKQGGIWNIEYTSAGAAMTRPVSPYVHTNHYLSELKLAENNKNVSGTFERYDVACSKTKAKMTFEDLRELTDDKSNGNIKSIMNNRTIAKMIVDTEKLTAYVWMRRENDVGWIQYKLDELVGW